MGKNECENTGSQYLNEMWLPLQLICYLLESSAS
jgi:hypothetical protein